MALTITIPEPTKRYSIYADGVLDELVMRMKDKSIVTLDDRWPVTLYYRFGIHRHLYACAAPALLPDAPVKVFKDVPRPLAVIAELTGRSFDRYKRAMWRLKESTDGKIMRMPPEFFWMLAQKCEQGKNSMEAVDRLAEKFIAESGRLRNAAGTVPG